jgi:cytochrome c oxidase subunit 2
MAVAAWGLAGCAGPQSVLDPAGPSAAAIAMVWWWMFGVAVVVLAGICVIWLLAMRPRAEAPDEDAARRIQRRWLVGGGLVLPGVSIVALLVFGSPAGFHQLPLPGAGPAPLRVDAIGHQWWWEMHYPDNGVRLKNEMRVPVGRAVDVHTQSSDVIHSFWVPRLGGKLDAVPGRTLVVRLQADRAGTYRGQCAEFCGTGHAHMTMTVIAMEPADFDAWLRTGQAPVPLLTDNEPKTPVTPHPGSAR